MNKIYHKIILLSIIGIALSYWQREISIIIFILFSVIVLYFVYDEQKHVKKQMDQYRFKKNSQLQEVKEEKNFHNDLLDSLIKTMNMPMLFLDKEGIIAYANDSFINAFDLPDIMNTRYQDTFTGQLLTMIEHSFVFQRRFNTVICVNDTYYQIDGTPLFNEDTFNGAFILFTDVSQMKEVERVQKQFFSDISNQLKTPMSAIINSLESFSCDDFKDNETFNEFMAILLKESYRMQHIINDIFELSRLEQPQVRIHPTVIDIERLIKESVDMFEQKARKKHISIIYQNYIKEGIVLDYTTMKTIVNNLVSNAVKYSKEGVITIKTKQSNNQFILTVQDEGIGIDKEHIPFVFDKFFQVDRSRSKKIGTGLGLSIVKRMVELNNGSIDLESTPNIGSTFTVTIPL